MRSWWDDAQTGAAYEFGARHYRLIFGTRVAGRLAAGLWWLTKRVVLPLAAVALAVSLLWFLVTGSWRFAVEHDLGQFLAIGVGIVGGALVLRWLFRRRGPLRKMIRRNF